MVIQFDREFSAHPPTCGRPEYDAAMPNLAHDFDVAAMLRHEGPLTGAELADRTRVEPLALWRHCRRAPEISCERIGRRYLRLDRAVEGYARLSPSIRREFLTYTVLGLEANPEPARAKAAALAREIERISRDKLELAREIMISVVDGLPEAESLRAKACFLIGGDVVYGMSHLVPRPESSTGKMVNGSDLDIVVIANDDLPDSAIKSLDDAIYRKKSYLLMHPSYREEIDYIIKRLARVREQLAFDSLKSMIACKIMAEGEFLTGNRQIFDTIKELVERSGAAAGIAVLQARAISEREQAEQSLLESDCGLHETGCANLFFTAEEGEEIA